MTDSERFLSLVSRKTAKGCWLWRAAISWDGYGLFKLNGKMLRAHRASWMLFREKIPSRMSVLHTCDNPPCVNPDHLFIGTAKDNHDDMVVKGRGVRGERNGRHKLNRLQARVIRRCVEFGVRQQYLADLFGVSQAVVSSVKHRKTWR